MNDDKSTLVGFNDDDQLQWIATDGVPFASWRWTGTCHVCHAPLRMQGLALYNVKFSSSTVCAKCKTPHTLSMVIES